MSDNNNQLVDCVRNRKFDFVKYVTINRAPIDSNTFISIVMTTHNRKEQTLHTLQTFNQSKLATQIIVILIDDSSEDFISDIELKMFKFQITHITIDPCKKYWINPCVNYNIGFMEVQTDQIIVQNAEVLHCGDVIQYVHNHLTTRNYLVFDVRSVGDIDTKSTHVNHEIYVLNGYNMIAPYLEHRQYQWYQHSQKINRNFHFLTAITRENLMKLGGFAYEFAMGSCFDDNGLIHGIQHILGLEIHNVINETTHLMGVHQWHSRDPLSYNSQYHHHNHEIWLHRAFYQNLTSHN